MQFKTAQELNKIIDEHLPSVRPPFCRHEVTIGGEGFEVYYRDVIECVKALLGDARLDPHLIFVPEFHYTDETKQSQIFHDMHTSRWWWYTQVSCMYIYVYIMLLTTLNLLGGT